MDQVTEITQKNGRELTSSTSKIGALEKMKVSEKFAVFWHEECFLHKIQDHPEQPDRVSAILTALRKIYSDDCFREAPLVTAEQILLFHTASHLKDLITLCDMSEKGYDENDEEEMYQSIDGDTVVMWKTRRAVWRAAGSAVAAIDDLYLQPGNSHRIRYLFKKITGEVCNNQSDAFIIVRSRFDTDCQETMCLMSNRIISHFSEYSASYFFHVLSIHFLIISCGSNGSNRFL